MTFNNELTVGLNKARANRLRAKGESKGVKNSNIVRKCERNIRNANKRAEALCKTIVSPFIDWIYASNLKDHYEMESVYDNGCFVGISFNFDFCNLSPFVTEEHAECCKENNCMLTFTEKYGLVKVDNNELRNTILTEYDNYSNAK